MASLWNPLARGAFDLGALRVAQRLAPRSVLGKILMLLSLNVPKGDVLGTAGLEVLHAMYLDLVRHESGYMRELILAAYMVNHPIAYMNPRAPENQDEDIVVVSTGDLKTVDEKKVPFVPFNSDSLVDLAARTSCPKNTRGTSCFVDTPFVLMFLGTDAYDGALLAREIPADLRPSTDEIELLQASDDIKDVCSVSADYNDVLEIRRAVRNVVAGIRAGPNNRPWVEANISAFRDTLAKCRSDTTLAFGQEDAMTIYETILLMSGWSRWYSAPVVSINSTVALNGVPLETPQISSASVTDTRASLRVILLRPDPLKAGTLQEIVDQTFPAQIAQNLSILPYEFEEIQKMLEKDPDSMESRAAVAMLRKAVTVFVENGERERLGLMQTAQRAGVPTDKIPGPFVAVTAELPPDPRQAFEEARDVYANTLGAVRNARDVLNRENVSFSPFRAQSPYQVAYADTSVTLRKLALTKTDTSVQYMTRSSGSGTLVLDGSSYRTAANAPDDPPIALPADRILTLSVGPPGRAISVKYRVFAAMIKTEDPERGHYTGYFWRGDDLYYYDDASSSDSPLRRATATDPSIETTPIFYFIQRVEPVPEPDSLTLPPPGSP